MFRIDKLGKFTVQCVKYTRNTNVTSPQSVQFIRRIQNATPYREKTVDANVIENFCRKFRCSEQSANYIYNKYPSLRSIDAIQNDTLEMLQNKLEGETILENPSLVTMDINTLKDKIKLIEELEPKKLDDFAPLMVLNGDELKKLVQRLSKEKDLIEQKNRIYFLSEKLQVEPRIVSKYRATCGYEIFHGSFKSLKKKLNILLDYGAKPMDILNGLYVLRNSDSIFVRRAEQMLSVGLPIKMWQFRLSEEELDALAQKYATSGKQRNSDASQRMAKVLKKRNLEKAIIVETLKSLLDCNDSESSEIYYNYVNEINELDLAKKATKYLLNNGISRKVIKENGFLLVMPISEIEEKLEILRKAKSPCIEDIVPLMKIDSEELITYVPECADRIHYFSERLNIPVGVVAAHLVEHKDVFLKGKVGLLKPKLDVLLKYEVDHMSILNCKQTFRLSVRKIEEIVNKLKNNGIKKISSWMVIPEGSPEYEKVITEHMKETSSLEGFDSNLEYISHRLNWNESDLQTVLKKCPMIQNASASRIKTHLDFLLTIFSPEDITHFPYIFHKNIAELKIRLGEMNKLGVPITLPYLYQSKSRYLNVLQKYFMDKQDESSQSVFLAAEERLKNKKSYEKVKRPNKMK